MAIPNEVLQTSILMVDDHPANLLALEAILAPLGQRLVRAATGEEALRRVLDEEFAVILMDVQMPKMDGFEAVSLIKQRERSRHIPVIFLTAINREAGHVFKGYQQGAVDYLIKPFPPEILYSKVSAFVELHLEKQKLRRHAEALRILERGMLERRSEYRYQRLSDSMPQCVLAARVDGEVAYVNRPFLQYSGLSLEVSVGSGYLSVVHPEDRSALQKAWAEGVRQGNPFEAQFRMLRAADHIYRWHLGRGVPEHDESGAMTGFIVTATDIDDQKKTEAQLLLANEAKDAFLAAASHELRTPLAAAKGYTHLALAKYGTALDPGVTKCLSSVNRQLDSLSKLVGDLLDVGRLASGRLALDLGSFELGPMLEDARERLQVLSSKHPITLEAPAALEVCWDRGRVDQVVTNLVSNAIRYCPAGGPIAIQVAAEGEKVELRVADRGLGIPPEKQAQIFERFGRAHGSRYGGLGLGLNISQGIVEQHGGKIRVQSSGVAGEGSVFTVELPRRCAIEPEAFRST